MNTSAIYTWIIGSTSGAALVAILLIALSRKLSRKDRAQQPDAHWFI